MTHLVDLTVPEIHANPFPLYAELRKTNPVCQLVGGLWAVTRYDDVQHIFRHPELFSSAGYAGAWLPPWLNASNPLAESMLVMDPPEHTKLRNLINRAFGPSMAARMEPHVRAIAEELASRIEPGVEVDFVSAFGGALPTMVIAEVLGLDASRHEEISRWIRVLTEISPITPPSLHEMTRATLVEMSDYFYGFIASRRKAPTGDIVSSLIAAEIEGARLSDRDIVAFLFLVVAAAIETTGHLLSNSALLLAAAPKVTALLREDPSRIPQFIEEMLRYDGPGQAVLRLVKTTTEIAGVTIPGGSLVLAIVASAHRDEKRFPKGDEFDLTRDVQGSLQFGHGVHHCVGAVIARLEARVAFEVLLSRFGGVERTAGEIEWNTSLITRGAVKLPVRFLPAP